MNVIKNNYQNLKKDYEAKEKENKEILENSNKLLEAIKQNEKQLNEKIKIFGADFVENNKEGYLYKLIGNYNNARAYRVNELLNNYIKNNTKISVDNAITILKDVKDSNAEYIVPKYLEIIKIQLQLLQEHIYHFKKE